MKKKVGTTYKKIMIVFSAYIQYKKEAILREEKQQQN